ncbi:hypothetical protein GUJ93_ZPchr0004g38680 [Zizania palustris]|uniref:Uncharacterized protein n=1 Tax=Zizania palustris TaxID=103762 RepID=A0A8J5VYM8_ZIZPA|nr:hypothetical protein GUJ93_ZPchr0004g38680 [Zizania palustris]
MLTAVDGGRVDAAAAEGVVHQDRSNGACRTLATSLINSFCSCLRWMYIDHTDGSSVARLCAPRCGRPGAARVALPCRTYNTQGQGSLSMALVYVMLPRSLPSSAAAACASTVALRLYMDRLRHDSQDIHARSQI